MAWTSRLILPNRSSYEAPSANPKCRAGSEDFAAQVFASPGGRFFVFLDKYTATKRCQLGIFAQMP